MCSQNNKQNKELKLISSPSNKKCKKVKMICPICGHEESWKLDKELMYNNEETVSEDKNTYSFNADVYIVQFYRCVKCLIKFFDTNTIINRGKGFYFCQY